MTHLSFVKCVARKASMRLSHTNARHGEFVFGIAYRPAFFVLITYIVAKRCGTHVLLYGLPYIRNGDNKDDVIILSACLACVFCMLY